MTFNHLVLVGGGHTNVLLMRNWLMKPHLMPKCPISIISRDSHLVYSAMFPSVIAREIMLEESLIDISSLANSVKVSFIKDEVIDINFISKNIFFQKRLSIPYSKVILNFGGETKVSDEFRKLIRDKIAFTIKPFFKAYEIIKSEDLYDDHKSLPFVIVGSGLAAIEMAHALRKRWKARKIILVCKCEKLNKQFMQNLSLSNIEISEVINFEFSKMLLCTGNQPPLWIKQNILNLDSIGRIITSSKINLKNFQDVFAVGDCSSVVASSHKSSGLHAVKIVNSLSKNIHRSINKTKLKNWFPKKTGLQILNCFHDQKPKAYLIYGNKVLGPNFIYAVLKKKIDKDFIQKLRVKSMHIDRTREFYQQEDCRGCASKIPYQVLANSLRISNLSKIADFPEDANEIFKNEKKVYLQSVDGFPALVSDPWVNSKITALHACSDLWACGAKISNVQMVVKIPKLDKTYQDYLFSHVLHGVKVTVNQLDGEIVGGHTYESRNIIDRPYPLEVDLSLTVQGIVEGSTWKKSGMKEGDSLFMSRELGVGIFFASQMKNINLYSCYDSVFENILTSQQFLVDEINYLQERLGEKIINAATDITGYGFIGHLSEMIDATNLLRKKEGLTPIKASLKLNSFRAYPGIFDLIQLGIRSSLYDSNKIKYDQIFSKDLYKRSITFSDQSNLNEKKFLEILELLIDPQTCGPLLISCNSAYENYLSSSWYKVGEVIN